MTITAFTKKLLKCNTINNLYKKNSIFRVHVNIVTVITSNINSRFTCPEIAVLFFFFAD